MKPLLKMLWHPLFPATLAVALACAWAVTYTSVTHQARLAAELVHPWSSLAHEQLVDVAACQTRASKALGVSAPQGPANEASTGAEAYACASAYLLSEPTVSSAAAAQTLSYAVGSTQSRLARGQDPSIPVTFETLFAKAAKDARAATRAGEQADKSLLSACEGLLAPAACSLAQLTPDRADRRLGDAMRDFEIDLYAQHEMALDPQGEARFRTGSNSQATRASPAYAKARTLVYALR